VRPSSHFTTWIRALSLVLAEQLQSLRSGLKLSGLVAWLVWLRVHIFYLVGFRKRRNLSRAALVN
jgi:NADH dehydrogenase FAD-containing subunit